MDVFGYIKQLLLEDGIILCGALPLFECKIKYAHKLSRCDFKPGAPLSAVIFAVPYLSYEAFLATGRNISLYAVPRDYHNYFSQLYKRILPTLCEKYPGYKFCGFSDSSPICETEAAAAAGLGVIGDNHLLITEKYSSFVFLGEIITDCPIPDYTLSPIGHCESCGRCMRACPAQRCGVCLSELTQKKGELSGAEEKIIRSHGSAWGCDICQTVCPHTSNAIERGSIFTEIPFFKEDLTPSLTIHTLEIMSGDEFACRAYSWRGKQVILRNLKILEETQREGGEEQC